MEIDFNNLKHAIPKLSNLDVLGNNRLTNTFKS